MKLKYQPQSEAQTPVQSGFPAETSSLDCGLISSGGWRCTHIHTHSYTHTDVGHLYQTTAAILVPSGSKAHKVSRQGGNREEREIEGANKNRQGTYVSPLGVSLSNFLSFLHSLQRTEEE